MTKESRSETSIFTVQEICQVAIFTALIAILAQISIPLPGGVPLTLQTLAIPLAGLVLGAKKGTAATLVYVLLGAAGVPVFAGFKGGLGSVLGLTGGFIISFPLMAFISGLAADRDSKRLILPSLFLGAIANYAIGTVWFSIASQNSLMAAYLACVLPFIPTAILKIFIASWLGPMLKGALIRAGLLK